MTSHTASPPRITACCPNPLIHGKTCSGEPREHGEQWYGSVFILERVCVCFCVYAEVRAKVTLFGKGLEPGSETHLALMENDFR